MNLTLHSTAAAHAALLRIQAGGCAIILHKRIERSRHNLFKIEGYPWMAAPQAAEALYLIGTKMQPAERQAETPQPIYPLEIRALTISPFYAYQICTGAKGEEFRCWATRLRDTIILIHTNGSEKDKALFQKEGISLENYHKNTIIGAATIVDCIKLAPRDYSHILATPILFEKPVRGVPGARQYWEAKGAHHIRAFNAAWERIMNNS